MKAYRTETTFNEYLFKWLKGLPFKANEKVEIIVLPAVHEENTLTTSDVADDDWHNLSLNGLVRAYSDEEPEYTMNMVKEENPDYERR